MKNLKIFGSAIHDTALVFIVTSAITSVGFSFFTELGRFEANICLIVGAVSSILYYLKEYKS